jgi:hypothetical protein
MPQVRLYRYEHAGRNDLIRVNVTYRTGVVVAPSFNVGWFALNKNAVKLHLSPGVSTLMLRNNRSLQHYGAWNSEQHELSMAFAINFQAGIILGKHMIVNGYVALPARISSTMAYAGEHQSLQLTAGYKF